MANILAWRDDRPTRLAYAKRYYADHSTSPRRIPGAERESKTCKMCGIEKARGDFTVRRTGRVGHLVAHCKDCNANSNRGKARIKNERDSTHYRRVEWPSKLKRLYGITVDQYNKMLANQKGGCALCGSTSPLTGNRTYKRTARIAFDVDHDHKTGKVRGLLCTRCNRLVGLANDDANTARRLVEYLS